MLSLPIHPIWGPFWPRLTSIPLSYPHRSSSSKFNFSSHYIALSNFKKSGHIKISVTAPLQGKIAPELTTFDAIKNKKTGSKRLTVISRKPCVILANGSLCLILNWKSRAWGITLQIFILLGIFVQAHPIKFPVFPLRKLHTNLILPCACFSEVEKHYYCHWHY